MLILKEKLQKNGKELQPLSHSKGLCDKSQMKEEMRSQKWHVCKKKRGLYQTTNKTKMCRRVTGLYKLGTSNSEGNFIVPTVLHRWERLYPIYCILISVSVEVCNFQKKRFNVIIW